MSHMYTKYAYLNNIRGEEALECLLSQICNEMHTDLVCNCQCNIFMNNV